MVPGVFPLALPGHRSLEVVCSVGLTDLDGGSSLSCQPLRPTKTMATASFHFFISEHSIPWARRALWSYQWFWTLLDAILPGLKQTASRNPAVTTLRFPMETCDRGNREICTMSCPDTSDMSSHRCTRICGGTLYWNCRDASDVWFMFTPPYYMP